MDDLAGFSRSNWLDFEVLALYEQLIRFLRG